MSVLTEIDTNFDVRSDAHGKDPDSHSPRLRQYHRLLWSKPLPDGTLFALEDLRSKGYLRHLSKRGEFRLSSDTVLRTFSKHKRMRHIIAAIPEVETEEVLRRGHTIGGFILFPSVKVDGKLTINQARGFNSCIEDRFDLTLECIRRHYADSTSPLADDLARYRAFFDLFSDFRGYVDFFFLQDLVEADYSAIRFWAPFSGFATSPLPADIDAYRSYRTAMLTWIDVRNRRIAAG